MDYTVTLEEFSLDVLTVRGGSDFQIHNSVLSFCCLCVCLSDRIVPYRVGCVKSLWGPIRGVIGNLYS